MASSSRPTATTDRERQGALRLLSTKEGEVLAVTALGFTNRETAARIGVSVHAVKFHLAAVYRKLGVANRTQAVAMFVSAKSDSNGS